MRITVLILGIIGAIISALLAFKWLSDASKYKELIEAAGASGEIDKIVRGAYALLVAAALGVGGGILTLKEKGKLAAGLFLFAAVMPAILLPKTLIATFLFLICAGLAFRSKSKVSVHWGAKSA